MTLLTDGDIPGAGLEMFTKPEPTQTSSALRERQLSPKRATGSVASAQSSASDAARRDLRRTNHKAPPATAPTASTTFHFTRQP